MIPLICFYQEKKYIFSEVYLRLECPDHQSVIEFLSQIEKKYFSELKIVQINFEGDEKTLYAHQAALYPSKKSTVFILEDFSIGDLPHETSLEEGISFRPLTGKEDFLEKTKYIVDQIKLGRIYQANLTAPLQGNSKKNSLDIFLSFHSQFAGQYKALLPLSEADLLCFSPELFLCQSKGTLRTQPIKGSLKKDESFSEQLIKNEKENAELSMIVDLMRNDLNSLSDKYSSVLKRHRAQMQLGYIQHTFSEIEVHSESSLPQIIEKTFPGGSISGCPKLESLEVIREVEKYRRQAYTGSLGWWQKNDFCLNIAIRTLIKKDNNLYYHAGCGIVYDSNPEAEWQEYLLKAGVLNVQF